MNENGDEILSVRSIMELCDTLQNPEILEGYLVVRKHQDLAINTCKLQNQSDLSDTNTTRKHMVVQK